MDRQQLGATLRELVEEETGEPCPDLDPNAEIRTGLNMDSMDLVGLIFRIERHFKVQISSDQLNSVVTVSQLLDLLEQQIARGADRQAA